MHWTTIRAKNWDRQDTLNNTGSNVRPGLKIPKHSQERDMKWEFSAWWNPYLQQITPAKIKLSYCPSERHKIKSHRLIKNGSCESEFTAEGRASLSVHSSVMSRCTAAQENPGGGRGQTNWQMERTNGPGRSWLLSPLTRRSKPPTFITWPPLQLGSEDIREPQWRVGLKMTGLPKKHEPVLQIYSFERGKSEAWGKRCFPFLKPIRFTGSSGCQAYMGWELRRHAMWQRWHGLNMTLENRQCVCVYDWLILQ